MRPSVVESVERDRFDPQDKTTPRIRGTTPDVERAAQKLRRQLTPTEARLWRALRGRKLGELKFRCQHPVGWFVLDFYCPTARLVVELDGGIHDREDQREHDLLREEQLRAYGYRVIRFRNEEIEADLDTVLEKIRQAALES